MVQYKVASQIRLAEQSGYLSSLNRKRMEKWLILLNLTTTAYLTGLIWFVQWVHYASFHLVDRSAFVLFHQHHTKRTGQVVALPMVVELLVSLALVWSSWSRTHFWMPCLGLVAVLLIWLVTFGYFVPLHGKLPTQSNAKQFYFLVKWNWVRTVSWTIRLLLLLVYGSLSLTLTPL